MKVTGALAWLLGALEDLQWARTVQHTRQGFVALARVHLRLWHAAVNADRQLARCFDEEVLA